MHVALRPGSLLVCTVIPFIRLGVESHKTVEHELICVPASDRLVRQIASIVVRDTFVSDCGSAIYWPVDIELASIRKTFVPSVVNDIEKP